MELRTTNGQLKAGETFRLIATGYFFGALVIFGPLFLLANVVMIVQNPRFLFGLAQLIVLPIVLAIQAAMFGGVTALGLWLYQKRKPIQVVDDAAPL